MANLEKDVNGQEDDQRTTIGEDILENSSGYREENSSELIGPVSLKKTPYPPSDHQEETAAEIAAPVSLNRRKSYDDLKVKRDDKIETRTGTGLGFLALALSIISLFAMPILFGIAGIVLGFIARNKGAAGLGAWAIGIGVVSIVVGIFILPFF